MSLKVQPIRTSIFRSQQSLAEFLKASLYAHSFAEGTVFAITSKIVSLSEGCFISKNKINKIDLIKEQADVYLGEINHGTRLAIKHSVLLPAAGIDESNAEGDVYITLPPRPFESAERIYRMMSEITGLKKMAVIITDSHTMPLRMGVTGISLAYWGFKGLQNKINTPDLFGRSLQLTQIDVVDALAASAVLMMGEANESCPLAAIEGAPVEFYDGQDSDKLFVEMQNDLYFPMYQFLMEKNK